MTKLIAGTVTELRGSHKRHRRSLWTDRTYVAKTSLWATVTDASGQAHKVWVGKIRGRSGVPTKRQEDELASEAGFLLGLSVVFEQKHDGFKVLFGIKNYEHGTLDAFIAELGTRAEVRRNYLAGSESPASMCTTGFGSTLQ